LNSPFVLDPICGKRQNACASAFVREIFLGRYELQPKLAEALSILMEHLLGCRGHVSKQPGLYLSTISGSFYAGQYIGLHAAFTAIKSVFFDRSLTLKAANEGFVGITELGQTTSATVQRTINFVTHSLLTSKNM